MLFPGATVAQNTPLQVVSDTAVVNILSVQTDSFPQISVNFKAQTQNNYPLWQLDSSQIKVFEGQTPCIINRLIPVSKQKPVQLGLILDRSTSMATNPNADLWDILLGNHLLPVHKQPYTKAKKAISYFLQNFDYTKDSVTIVAFATKCLMTQHSNDTTYLQNQLNKFALGNSTAFYDAIDHALVRLHNKTGNKVIVALTDGNDNTSKRSLKTILKTVNYLDIPVYIIALGDVNHYPLQQIATQSGGQLYQTNNPAKLTSIYQEIRKKILAVYNVTYASTNFNEADSLRAFSLQLTIDTLFCPKDTHQIELTTHAMQTIRKTNLIQAQKQKQKIWGGLAIITTVAVGSFLFIYFRKRRKQNPEAQA